VPLLGYYKKRFALKAKDFPVSSRCEKLSLALPLHNRMTAEDYEYVVREIRALN
jgi:dTDP-4-amino-4,6-dideoxygalactose transaminase